MHRKIGACSWILGNASDQEIAEGWQTAGLNGVEYNPIRERANASATSKVFNDFGLSIYSLTPPDADLSSPDDGVRKAGIDTYFWLIDFAASVGSPIISCHGLVGRIAPIASQKAEDLNLINSVDAITKRAKEANINVVFEVLNRYETHQIRTTHEASKLITQINQPNLSILLDSYHMNIEESDPADAIQHAGKHLGLYHMADSNREAPGRGHIDFASQLRALDSISYQGPIILEINTPGPNPFSPDKGQGFRKNTISQLSESVAFLNNSSTEQAA
ncbi:sugar phosphate isomerase/epimerase family protein [Kiloniella sp.]|uniref:sugar phosphate isomerase/epimerase family protein n=1 Tax=Kiloniella sp. TaxID=1938587 RepID=UPI003B01E3CF